MQDEPITLNWSASNGEVQLGLLLDQMLAPEQYVVNARSTPVSRKIRDDQDPGSGQTFAS